MKLYSRAGTVLGAKQQPEKSFAAAIQNGNLCNEPIKIKVLPGILAVFLVDKALTGTGASPESGPRAEGVVKYSWTKGILFLPLLGGSGSIDDVEASTRTLRDLTKLRLGKCSLRRQLLSPRVPPAARRAVPRSVLVGNKGL
ncbi:unnamed protein product [Tuber aestivum]|uniref:Uncharacterized protein n=1 Tax=Tuber aestivum TaxID=59557 RepID=A0A292Q0J6_9PEZI|nr:unnamed protein product [Tuber aestivum]